VLREADGRIGGMMAIAIETTERVRAVAAREEGERRMQEVVGIAGLSSDFRALFEASPTPLLVVSPPDYLCIAVNDAYLRATMTTRENLLGIHVFDAFPENPADPSASGVRNLRASFDRVVATGRADVMAPQKYDIPRRDAAGTFEERWWSPVNSPVHGPDGRVVGIIHRVEDVTEIVRLQSEEEARNQIARDLQTTVERLREANREIVRREAALRESERERAEEALRASEERCRLIVEGARDYAILTTDADGRIDSWAPGAEAVFGWTAEEAIGRPVAMIFTPEDQADDEPGKERWVAREHGFAPSVRWHQRKDGTRVFIDGIARVLRGQDGEVRGFLKIGQDVTNRREAEQERERLLASERAARAEAEAANQAKADFLASMSSALRSTPSAGTWTCWTWGSTGRSPMRSGRRSRASWPISATC